MWSCDDPLDKEPLGAISGDAVFNDNVLLTGYVNASYNAIRNGFFQQRLTTDALTDNAYHMHPSGTWEFNRGQMIPDNGEAATFDLWSHSYSSIRRLNIYFDGIESSTVDPDLLERLNGEMYFIRAYTYAELLRYYGGVPIIETTFKLGDEFNQSRASYEEVVSYIVDDLDEAIRILQPLGKNNNNGRATSHAAMALKSRVLLYAASPLNNASNDRDKWQAASDAAKAVIDLGVYSLHDDYQDLFLGDGSPEHIWTRTFNLNDGTSLDLVHNPNGYGGWGGTLPLQNLIDAYEMSNGELPLLEDGSVNPASGYAPADPFINRDPRFYSTINHHGALWKGRNIDVSLPGGLDSPDQSVGGWWNASRSGYYTKKYLTESNPVNNTDRTTVPWIFFRLGEIYLNYAEAQIELDQEDEAKTYLNLIRQRAGMPDITESGADLKKRYRHERRIELVFEDHRLFDIQRWLIAHEVLGKTAYGVNVTPNGAGGFNYDFTRVVDDTRAWKDAYLRFPIPPVDLEISQPLEQNPDY